MNPVRRAIRHAGRQGWPRAQVLERQPQPDGTTVIVLHGRDPFRRVGVTYGVRVSRHGQRVLADDLAIEDPPAPDRAAEVRTP